MMTEILNSLVKALMNIFAVSNVCTLLIFLQNKKQDLYVNWHGDIWHEDNWHFYLAQQTIGTNMKKAQQTIGTNEKAQQTIGTIEKAQQTIGTNR